MKVRGYNSIVDFVEMAGFNRKSFYNKLEKKTWRCADINRILHMLDVKYEEVEDFQTVKMWDKRRSSK